MISLKCKIAFAYSPESVLKEVTEALGISVRWHTAYRTSVLVDRFGIVLKLFAESVPRKNVDHAKEIDVLFVRTHEASIVGLVESSHVTTVQVVVSHLVAAALDLKRVKGVQGRDTIVKGWRPCRIELHLLWRLLVT